MSSVFRINNLVAKKKTVENKKVFEVRVQSAVTVCIFLEKFYHKSFSFDDLTWNNAQIIFSIVAFSNAVQMLTLSFIFSSKY
jgi:hypothetical protein